MNVTNPRASPIFNATSSVAHAVALVSNTVVAAVVAVRATLAFTDIRCKAPNCGGVIMRVPGTVRAEVHIRSHGYVPQQGRSVRCRKCKSYNEVIEHA